MNHLDEIRRSTESEIQAGQNALLQHLHVSEDDESSMVPKALRPAVNFAINTWGEPIVTGLSDYVYKGAHKAASKVITDSAKIEKFSKAAEWSSVALLLGIPIIEGSWSAFSSKWKAGDKIYDEFKPVIEATGANKKTNGVMAIEYDRVHDNFMSQVRGMWPKIPMYLVNLVYAKEHLRENQEKREVHGFGMTEAQKLENTRRLAGEAKQIRQRAEERLAEDRKNFAQNPLNQALGETEAERLEYYDNRRAKDKYDGFLDEEKAKLTPKVPRNRIVEWMLAQKDQTMVKGMASAATQGLELYASDENKKHTSLDDATPWEMIKALGSYLGEIAEPGRGGECFTHIDHQYVDAIKGQVKKICERYHRIRHHEDITGAGNLEALDKVTQKIAEALVDGTIEHRALVVLVGDDKIIKKERGKTVINVAAAEKQIAALQDKLGVCVAPDPKEFYDHFDSPEVMKKALKKHLGEMQGIDKSCFAALFSDGVLKAAGMKQEEITAARKQARGHMYKLVASNMKELAKKSDEELTKLQIKKDDIDTLLQIADQIESGDMQAVKGLVEGHGRIVLQNIMGVAALQELQTDKNAWTERMKAQPGLRRRGDASKDAADNPHEQEDKAAEQTNGAKSERETRIPGPRERAPITPRTLNPADFARGNGEGASENLDYLKKGFDPSAEKRLENSRKDSPEERAR